MVKKIFLMLLVTFLFTATLAYDFYGYVKYENGTPVQNANVSFYVYYPVPDINWTNNTLTNQDGFFNITVNTSNLTSKMCNVKIYHYDSSGLVDYIGPITPPMPCGEYTGAFGTPAIQNITFYLKKAVNLNITVVNSTGAPANFSYIVKDTRLGYPIAENTDPSNPEIGNVVVAVPADRNYSITVFPMDGFPQSNYTQLTGSELKVDFTFNTSTILSKVVGYVKRADGGTSWDNLTVIAYFLEPGNMVYFGAPLPYDMEGTDTYNLTTGQYNISLPSVSTGAKLLLFATAYNASEDTYYGGFINISLTPSGLTDTNITNITVYKLAGQVGNITLQNSTGDNINITTKLAQFNFKNQTSTVSIDAHLEAEVDCSSIGGAQFTWMHDVDNSSSFGLPLIESINVDRVAVYTMDYAPREISNVNLTMQPINITLYPFQPADVDGDPFQDLYLDLFKSNATCDVPYPSAGCSLTADVNISQFNPLTVILGGGKISFRMEKLSNGIAVHYENVDLLASGPPDALFDSQASESTTNGVLEAAWRFGSRGPTIYDEVLMGIPYDESDINESKDIRVVIEYFYDDNWNVIWDGSAQNWNISTLPENYADFGQGEYAALVNNSQGTLCSKTDQTALCYVNTSDNKVWIRIPHFSGVGTQIIAQAVTVSSTTESETTGGTETAEEEEEVGHSFSRFWDILGAGEHSWGISHPEVPITMLLFETDEQYQNVQFNVKTLLENPVDQTPGAHVYSYLKITSNIDVNNPRIRFFVERDWINENNLDENTVTLYRYSDGWEALDTELYDSDVDKFYYEASTPGFSYFAIVASEKEESAPAETAEEQEATEETPEQQNETEIEITPTPKEQENRTLVLAIAVIVVIAAALTYVVLHYMHKKK